MTQAVFADAGRDLFARLIDAAGPSPPDAGTTRAAVTAHREARAGLHGWMLGAIVIPAQALNDAAAALVTAMSGGEEPCDVSLVLGAEAGRGAADARSFEAFMGSAVRITAVTMPLPSEATDGPPEHTAPLIERAARVGSSIAPQAPCFVEIRAAAGGNDPVPVVAAVDIARRSGTARLGVSLRCAGATPDDIPEPDMLATLLAACRDRDLRFRLTGGIRRVVGRTHGTGSAAGHGILNLLTAAALTETRVAPTVVAAAVAEEDEHAFRVGPAGLWWRGNRVGGATLRRLRADRLHACEGAMLRELTSELASLGTSPPAST